MKTKIVGREYEQKLIQRYYDSPKSEMVAVYGRRRIGKTFLVKQCFDEQFDFWFTGMYEMPRSVQLSQFRKELERYSQSPIKLPKNWFEAFDLLGQYLYNTGKEKIVVFLDELPWMDTPKSDFLAAFSYFWNMWKDDGPLLKLYCCGSATTWMLNKFIGDKGGLYGRICRSIHLAPFTLLETEQFLCGLKGFVLGRQQILDVYMIMGGVPYYLDMLEGDIRIEESIDHLFFAPDAPLRMEYDFLFRSLFRSPMYRKVVDILSEKQKGMTRNELTKLLPKADGGVLTEILENLCKCDFVHRYLAIGKTERDMMYQLSDLFSLFHSRFVINGQGQDENFWSNMRQDGRVITWRGYAFEQVCLHHLPQIKSTLGIGGVSSNAYSWSQRPFVDQDGNEWKGGQVDLLIDRADTLINICEMKYYNDEFSIDADYEKRLRDRASLFIKVTKTHKTLLHTFVTTYGVKKNKYSGIVHSQVTMDDLFK